MRNINLKNSNKFYIIFLLSVLFIYLIFPQKLNAKTFKINNLEISEPFELSFNKNKVLDKGFLLAFDELLSLISTSKDKNKLKSTPLYEVKNLIDSFTISKEKFIDNIYYVNLDVNFNKYLTLKFFEKNNIFPSIPKTKEVLLIPIFFDEQNDEILLFNKNYFYDNWTKVNETYHLIKYILPNEDLEDMKNIIVNKANIEEYDFKKIITKYDLNDFIIILIFKNNEKIKVLSKINISNSLKVESNFFKIIDKNIENDFENIIKNLKVVYENSWKNVNKINTSIKLPLTISLDSRNYNEIIKIEKILYNLDLVSKFEISKFDSKKTFFKVVYNGSPKKFINDMAESKVEIFLDNEVWNIK